MTMLDQVAGLLLPTVRPDGYFTVMEFSERTKMSRGNAQEHLTKLVRQGKLVRVAITEGHGLKYVYGLSNDPTNTTTGTTERG